MFPRNACSSASPACKGETRCVLRHLSAGDLLSRHRSFEAYKNRRFLGRRFPSRRLIIDFCVTYIYLPVAIAVLVATPREFKNSPIAHPEMAALSTPLKLTAAFAVATGLMNLVAGVGWLKIITGVPLPVQSRAAVFADSQLRFFGAIWAGYGAMLWWASNDVRGRRVPLAILACTMPSLGSVGPSRASCMDSAHPSLRHSRPSSYWRLQLSGISVEGRSGRPRIQFEIRQVHASLKKYDGGRLACPFL